MSLSTEHNRQLPYIILPFLNVIVIPHSADLPWSWPHWSWI